MKWRIDFSDRALKFLTRNRLADNFIVEKIHTALRKLRGENINIDMRKLSGKWEGFYRIRSGRLRIIVEFRFEHGQIYIEAIDWRGRAYR